MSWTLYDSGFRTVKLTSLEVNDVIPLCVADVGPVAFGIPDINEVKKFGESCGEIIATHIESMAKRYEQEMADPELDPFRWKPEQIEYKVGHYIVAYPKNTMRFRLDRDALRSNDKFKIVLNVFCREYYAKAPEFIFELEEGKPVSSPGCKKRRVS